MVRWIILLLVVVLLLTSVDNVEGKRKRKKEVKSEDPEESDIEEIRYTSEADLQESMKKHSRNKIKFDKEEEKKGREILKKKEEEEPELRKNVFRANLRHGDKSREMASALHLLGKNVYIQNKFEEAAQISKDIMLIHESLDGLEHISTAAALRNMGAVNFRLGRKRICEAVMLRALDIFIKHHGAESKEVLLLRGQLLTFQIPFGETHMGIGREEYEEALAEAEEEELPAQQVGSASASDSATPEDNAEF